jgi:hypothetical protein
MREKPVRTRYEHDRLKKWRTSGFATAVLLATRSTDRGAASSI